MVIWGLIHSLLAARRVKRVLESALGRWYRLFYNVVAGITLLPVLALAALLPDHLIYQVPSPWRWVLICVQLAAALAAGITLLQTDLLRFLGVRQLIQPAPLPPNTLSLDGPYRWVRHPLYFFSLVFLWAIPILSLNILVLNLAFSAYFYIGAIFEERKLVAQFGQAYRNYQHQVPMLIPWRVSTQQAVETTP